MVDLLHAWIMVQWAPFICACPQLMLLVDDCIVIFLGNISLSPPTHPGPHALPRGAQYSQDWPILL